VLLDPLEEKFHLPVQTAQFFRLDCGDAFCGRTFDRYFAAKSIFERGSPPLQDGEKVEIDHVKNIIFLV